MHLALAPDGLLVALGANGSIWISSATRGNWICLPVGTADIRWVVITRTGNAAVVLDAQGRMIGIDLDAAQRQLAIAS